MKPLVIDLSHYDPAEDYAKVKAEGVVGIIYKATQGSSYTDPTYCDQRKAALAAGLKWGAYHFGDGSDPLTQAANFLAFAQVDDSTVFCLDYEDNGDNTMALGQAQLFVRAVEFVLERPGQCVLYSGNLIKEDLSGPNRFWNSRRLWLADYNDEPALPAGYSSYWLWQYTDGGYGPEAHTVAGCDSGGIDCDHYDGDPEDLAAEWASGGTQPRPPAPSEQTVTLIIQAPAGVQVNVVQQPC
jgi:GH25 family lysozyme M1 (1,4-beta-N-acetylmuramidase)